MAHKEQERPIKSQFCKITDSLFSGVYMGDYRFEQFLARGGASNEGEIFAFIAEQLKDCRGLKLAIEGMGCSTMQVKSENGCLFGRNFDWASCPLLVLRSYPQKGYASISSVNMDFINQAEVTASDEGLLLTAVYAPLDGMNEKGLCVSVHLLPDGMVLEQNSGRTNLTVTTAIRLLLDQAADTEEAVELLRRYDLHSSDKTVIHYMISDIKGNSVCVEYIDSRMSVLETPIVTNHYLTPGPYYGQGRNTSQQRYDTIAQALSQKAIMKIEDVREVMRSILHMTQWTVIYDQAALTAEFRHITDYEHPLQINL